MMDILLAGSISYDYIMRFSGRFVDRINGKVSGEPLMEFEVEDMHNHHGGVSANIAYMLALLGGKPRLFGTVGKDFEPYRQRLEAVGVDTSTCRVIPEVYTATFFANTDADNNQIGAFYSGAMGYARHFGIMEVAGSRPDLVVISPNDPQGMENHIHECCELGIPYIFDPSQQVARLGADVLRRGIEGCMAVACNEYEWEIVQKQTGYTIDRLQEGGRIFILTLGADGASIYHKGEQIPITPIPPTTIVNPTGAGDAFRGGFLRGLSLGLPLHICGQLGALCGTIALEHSGTQPTHFSLSEFVARFRQCYDDEGALDVLWK